MSTQSVFRLLVLLTLVVALGGTSCKKAEQVGEPPVEEPRVLQSSDEEGESSEGEVIPVATQQDFLVADSLIFADSLILLSDTLVVEIEVPPQPQQFISWLRGAYNMRNAVMLAMILADEYVCTEITPDGIRSWGKEEEARIHERMFNPGHGVKPIEEVELTLDNPDVTAPPEPDSIWVVRCEAHLVLDYLHPEDGTFEFLGPAEFHIRPNPDMPCRWELVAWHDQLPYGAE